MQNETNQRSLSVVDVERALHTNRTLVEYAEIILTQSNEIQGLKNQVAQMSNILKEREQQIQNLTQQLAELKLKETHKE